MVMSLTVRFGPFTVVGDTKGISANKLNCQLLYQCCQRSIGRSVIFWCYHLLMCHVTFSWPGKAVSSIIAFQLQL